MPPKKQQQQSQQQQQQSQSQQPQQPPTSMIMGIDFGTHYSSVGVIKNDRPELCPNQQGNRTTPSVVSFVGDDLLVGDEAKQQMDRNPLNTIYDAKKLLGFAYSDPLLQHEIKRFPYKVIDSHNDVHIEVSYQSKQQTFTPVDISAKILAQIKHTADTFMGKDIKRAVITVPSEFSAEQRKLVMEAAKIAGINVVRLISDHSAVALAYGYDEAQKQPQQQQQQPQNIMVFDLGGSGLSVSVIRIHRDFTFEILGNSFDHSLSGEAFDYALVKYLSGEFKKKYRCDLSDSARAVAKLKSASEKAKRNLSNMPQASIELDSLYEGMDFFSSVSRAKFEDVTGDVIRGAKKPLQEVLVKSGVTKESINRVIMVGGGSRIPAIHQLVVDFFQGVNSLDGQPLVCKTLPAEEVVCIGATIQAQILEQQGSSHGEKKVQNGMNMSVNVTPSSIGIDNGDGVFIPIIPSQTRLPATRTFKLSNSTDNQKQFSMSVYQGNATTTIDNQLLFKCILDIPTQPNEKGSIKFDFKFEIDNDNQLTIFSLSNNKTFKLKLSK